MNPRLLMLTLGLTTAAEILESSMVVLSPAHSQGDVEASPEEFVWVTAYYATAVCQTFAVASPTLQHRTAVHQTDLARNFSQANSAFSVPLGGLTRQLVTAGYSPADAHGAALALLQRTLGRQVLLLSYLDAFALLAAVGFMLMQNQLK